MKKIFFLLISIPAFSFAQQAETPVHKNELGLNLFSITDFQRYRGVVDKPEVHADFNYFSGIYYKRYYGKNVLRASFNYSQKSIQSGSGFEMPFYYYYSVAAVQKNLDISIGYERIFGTKKLQPYVFGDVVYNYMNYSGQQIYTGCFGPIEVDRFSEEVAQYGISAGAGLRYNISPNIHLSYEFAAQGFVNVFQDVYNAGPKYIDVGYKLNPVNKLGFAVSF
jgi:hypothetical protein